MGSNFNNPDWLSRTKLLLGEEKLNTLFNSNVLVVGLGGVGAYAAENLCRAGIGKMTIIDGDAVHPSNINRQLIAFQDNIDQPKAELVAHRLKSINRDLKLSVVQDYISGDKMAEFVHQDYDYIVDAIDTLAPKFNLILSALNKKIPLISSMGAGARTDPSTIVVKDISKSYNCTLARVLRKRLHKQGIRKGFKVVFSTENVARESVLPEEGQNKKSIVGTISYMPAIFGCICASVVIRDLINIKV